MALHIFNCSVDTPDPEPDSVSEDLSFNDMESVVEIILEQVFGIDNAIAEHDEPDEDANGFTIKKGLDVYNYKPFIKITAVPYKICFFNHSHYKEQFYELFHHEIASPPPKA